MGNNSKFRLALKNIPPKISRLGEIVVDLSQLINSSLEEKNMTFEEFANKLNQSEEQIHAKLSGESNLTIKDIIDMEIVLNMKLVIVLQ